MDPLIHPTQLTQIEQLPEGLTDVSPENLHQILPGPTLMHLAGKKPEPLFISVLLHGNEPTGFLAVQALLKHYRSRSLPRSISIFFGNILAAKENLRRLDAQPDYNRIWPGTEFPPSPETSLAEHVVDEMVKRNIFASIDIHNNTGLNPHYACVNVFQNRYFQLARLFSRLVVYFIRPRGVLSAAFGRHCPSVTLECGKPGQGYGVNHGLEYLESCLHLTDIPDHPLPMGDLDLFHSIAQITVPDKFSFGFADDQVDLNLSEDIDHMNFTEVPVGTVIGKTRNENEVPLLVRDEFDMEVTSKYFRIDNGELVLNRTIMPSMLTLDRNIIRQDCLGYVMERINAKPENHSQ